MFNVLLVADDVASDLVVETGDPMSYEEYPDQEPQPETSIKIERSVSPTPSDETETECENSTVTPGNNAQNPLEGTTTNLEDESNFPSEEVRYLEVQLLKEKLRAHQQENENKALHAELIQNMEFKILTEKLREAKAKADLAELCLKRQRR